MSHNFSGDGVREALTEWQVHTRDSAAKPGPDFRVLNKKALQQGLATSLGQRDFRTLHPVPLKQTLKLHTQLAKQCAQMVHGRPSDVMTLESIRISGKDAHIDMTKLLQNGFADEWIRQHEGKKSEKVQNSVQRGPTRAARGHAFGAQETLRRNLEKDLGTGHLFKMPRFKTVGPKVKVGK